MSIAVVTVNWNRWKTTQRCIQSVRREPDEHHFYVVDIGSTDDSRAQLQKMGTDVTLIEQATNSPWAGGVNVGIQRALQDNHKFILLLKNDAVLAPESLHGLTETNEAIMAAGSKLAPVIGAVHFQSTGQTGFVQAETDPATGIPTWRPGMDNTKLTTVFRTDYVDGALIFAHRSVFARTGKFDERFFLYFDDADWCFRARREGHRLFSTRAAAVLHDGSRAIGQLASPYELYFFVRNRLLFGEQHCTDQQQQALLDQQKAEAAFYTEYDENLTVAFRQAVQDFNGRKFGDCPNLIRQFALSTLRQSPIQPLSATAPIVEAPQETLQQMEANTSPGPSFEPETEEPPLTASPPVRLIAYYLPQFHPIPENDAWWGKGFTEWTNVSKALPRFSGHYQPRLPGDLGFYDLRVPDVLRRQAELAKKYGIHGFCFHYYWFSGTKLLETPLQLLLDSPEIDLPFCINWANENWTRRWDGQDSEILIQQHYSPEDDDALCDALIPIVRDPRYIHVDGRPLIMIYRPNLLPDMAATVERWRTRMRAAGVKEPYLAMAQHSADEDPRDYGFDAAAGFPPHRFGWNSRTHAPRKLLDGAYEGTLHQYDEMVARAVSSGTEEYPWFPGVTPGWDNDARKPNRGICFVGSTPKKYGAWLSHACSRALAAANPDERIVFINAWNEWAEGAYLEPDRHFGYAYLAETARALNRVAAAPIQRPLRVEVG